MVLVVSAATVLVASSQDLLRLELVRLIVLVSVSILLFLGFIPLLDVFFKLLIPLCLVDDDLLIAESLPIGFVRLLRVFFLVRVRLWICGCQLFQLYGHLDDSCEVTLRCSAPRFEFQICALWVREVAPHESLQLVEVSLIEGRLQIVKHLNSELSRHVGELITLDYLKHGGNYLSAEDH